MITKPTLLIDEKKCKQNITRMFTKAKANNLEFRPHFKTHQSLEIGSWFKNLGIKKITVSSLSMAKYFSSHWNDITVAFPINILEINTINNLAKKIILNLVVENIESVSFLGENLLNKVNVLIKIDIGNNRTGIDPNNFDLIDSILTKIDQSPLINFIGFLGHAGQTYSCRSQDEIKQVHSETLEKTAKLKIKYLIQYPNIIISLGDTPSCTIAENFEEVDEIRPGNFVFYDLMQYIIGSCDISQISVVLACPVVSIHESRSEIVVYGGGVHLSKERIDFQGKTVYGLLVQKINNGWGDIIPNTYVKSISQEHGIISIPKDDILNYKIGDIVYIIPVHSCMTANLMKNNTSLVENINEIILK